ncbi:uncharacterized protein LOC126672587 [Mercurialis annua]|uniref:uncharacterized protein LOC126672587 n=1 Tax=Mercurialis annua TaxID=3986 RepID=UPI00215E8703|nr:uncharacterized protein LOC126672587 [Mercurialis annua]
MAANRVLSESELIVRRRSEAAQKLQGDSLPPSTIIRFPYIGEVDFGQFKDLTYLRELWFGMSVIERTDFENRYGWIAQLAYVPMVSSILTAMLHFWDPSYNCFTFGAIDMCPIMEEYRQLINTEPGVKMYAHNKDNQGKRQLARFIGVSTANVTSWETQGSKDIEIASFINFIRETPNPQSKLAMMALLIYGEIMFPKSDGVIDERVVVLFNEINHRVDPIMPILAETLRSLTNCREGKSTKFNGCAQLLIIWALNHFKCSQTFKIPRLNYRPCYSTMRNYVTEFVGIRWPERGPPKKHWIRFLLGITEQDVERLCPKSRNQSIIYACGDMAWVPLLEPWGDCLYTEYV